MVFLVFQITLCGTSIRRKSQAMPRRLFISIANILHLDDSPAFWISFFILYTAIGAAEDSCVDNT